MKSTLLLLSAVFLVCSGLIAQRDTVFSTEITKSNGFIGMSPKGDSLFRIVQVEAEFPGGAAGWKSYLEQNLDGSLGARYIKIPIGHLY